MATFHQGQLVQIGEALHVIATQRDQAITERDQAQEQAEEWERTARGSSQAAVGWQSKAQTWAELAASVADDLEAAFRDPDKSLDTAADEAVARLRRVALWAGESLPSDGEVVRTEETVKVGDKL